MADKAGSVVGIRVNGGPLTIKVTEYQLDPEIKFNRSVTTSASQHPRTVPTQCGGIMRGTGYVDPSDTGCAYLLAAASSAITTNLDLTTVKFYIDETESGGARKGWDMGTCKLIIMPIQGQTDEGGMTRITFEIHSQAGMTYSTTLS